MSISVVCPNGHALRVADRFGGKTGLCPVCKARVKVPRPAGDRFSEDAILGILGPGEAVAMEDSSPVLPEPPAAPKPQSDGSVSSKKSCERCNREIPANIHVCPFCHNYIAGLAEV